MARRGRSRWPMVLLADEPCAGEKVAASVIRAGDKRFIVPRPGAPGTVSRFVYEPTGLPTAVYVETLAPEPFDPRRYDAASVQRGSGERPS